VPISSLVLSSVSPSMFCFHLVLPLLPIPTYFHHHHLFPPTYSQLFSPSSPTLTCGHRHMFMFACFHRHCFFRYLACFVAYSPTLLFACWSFELTPLVWYFLPLYLSIGGT
jgi:hypothetical protein